MTETIHRFLTAWAVFGGACTMCLYLRETLRRRTVAVRVRRNR